MAPKSVYTLEAIINAATEVVRHHGIEKLTARIIASNLGSSTMPIYSCGKSMGEIAEAVVERAWEVLHEYQSVPRTNEVFIDMGLGYVLFAKQERHLFKCLHNDRFKALNMKNAQLSFLKNSSLIPDEHLLGGLPDDLKFKIMVQGWIFSHGVADLLENGLSLAVQGLDSEKDITEFFMSSNQLFWVGVETLVANYHADNPSR